MPTRFAAVAGVVALLSGCAAMEPYERAYTWHPIGANESNLAAMAANPADLANGRGIGAADGQTAAAAVNRLRHDHPKSLPDSGGSSGAAANAAAGPTPN